MFQGYFNVGFLRDLVRYMTTSDPNARPTAKDALAKWQKIHRRLFSFRTFWRLRPRDDPWFDRLLRDISACRDFIRWLSHRKRRCRFVKVDTSVA